MLNNHRGAEAQTPGVEVPVGGSREVIAVWEVLRVICLGNRSKTIYYIDMKHGVGSYLVDCGTTGQYRAAPGQFPQFLRSFPGYCVRKFIYQMSIIIVIEFISTSVTLLPVKF